MEKTSGKSASGSKKSSGPSVVTSSSSSSSSSAAVVAANSTGVPDVIEQPTPDVDSVFPETRLQVRNQQSDGADIRLESESSR